MEKILEKILSDIEWRVSELASLRTIPHRYKIQEEHRNLLIRYSIPTIYSLWEGFVKNSFIEYIKDLNAKELCYSDLHINIVVHGITSVDKLKLENVRHSFISKKEFTEKYLSVLSKPIKISETIPTKSNIDFYTINEILVIFNLRQFEKNEFRSSLNRLIFLRNSIAHGDKGVPITLKDMHTYVELIHLLMNEVVLRIQEGYLTSSFRK